MLKIGEYNIYFYEESHSPPSEPGKVWIQKDDGEGGEFSLQDFSKAIESSVNKFYIDNL